MVLPFTKNYSLQKIPTIALAVVFAFLILTIVQLHYLSVIRVRYSWPSALKNSTFSSELSSPANHAENASRSNTDAGDENCDIFTGEWVPNPEAPYYTNTTCWAIHEHQNCMKYGRPDMGFMKWRWKPDGCDLPIFNPSEFLEMVKGKSMAFVGDSIARNHVQSLICLLSRVEYPIDASLIQDNSFRRWNYTSYNFTLVVFWTPFLVKVEEATGLYKLYLDEFDEKWTIQIQEFDYVVISAGHWFNLPGIYYQNRRIVGCQFCQVNNTTDLPATYAHRRAFRTAFRALNSLKNYKGITFLRTFAPAHFENGEYNNGGNCLRKMPFKRNETRLDGRNLEFYTIQLEEFRDAERMGKRKGLKFRLLDSTKTMVLRPDGHPSRFGHWPNDNENVTLYNDCVHWCLPGPIDSWSDFLLYMMKMEGGRSFEKRR